MHSPKTACGESLSPFLAASGDRDEVVLLLPSESDAPDDDEDEDDEGDSWPRPPPTKPSRMLLMTPPPPLPSSPDVVAYLTASINGLPTPVTLFILK